MQFIGDFPSFEPIEAEDENPPDEEVEYNEENDDSETESEDIPSSPPALTTEMLEQARRMLHDTAVYGQATYGTSVAAEWLDPSRPPRNPWQQMYNREPYSNHQDQLRGLEHHRNRYVIAERNGHFEYRRGPSGEWLLHAERRN